MSTTDNTPHDNTPQDDTLADDVFVDSTREPDAGSAQPTAALAVTPSPEPVTTAAPAAATAPGPATAARTADGPWLTGPAPFAIVLGILGLVVAGAVLLTELTDLTFPWADLGPWTVVAAGLVVVLVGAIGLRSSRRTHA